MNRLIDKINKDMLYYEATKKQIEIWLDIINEEFNTLTNYNPINHIKTRIKTAESILGKLKKKNLEISYENIFKLDDIVGARIVCDFVDNIYEIVSKLKNNSNINIIGEKDYIVNPKESGYRGYHIIVKVPISIAGVSKDINAEIQIRTTAMDFWASSEHKLNYKLKSKDNTHKKYWKDAASKVWELDIFMNDLYRNETNQREKSKFPIELINLNTLRKITANLALEP